MQRERSVVTQSSQWVNQRLLHEGAAHIPYAAGTFPHAGAAPAALLTASRETATPTQEESDGAFGGPGRAG
jgi:hypothetical protein